MLVLLIFAKILVCILWLIFGVPLLMMSVMAFDAPGSDKKFITYIPGILTIILALASIGFIGFVW